MATLLLCCCYAAHDACSRLKKIIRNGIVYIVLNESRQLMELSDGTLNLVAQPTAMEINSIISLNRHSS